MEAPWLCSLTSLPSVGSLEPEAETGTWVEVAYLGGDPRNLKQGRKMQDEEERRCKSVLLGATEETLLEPIRRNQNTF